MLLTEEVQVPTKATRTVSGMLLQGVSLQVSCFWQDPSCSTSSMLPQDQDRGFFFERIHLLKHRFGVLQDLIQF